MPHIFEVHELTVAVKDVIESQFPFVWVRGEVSEVSKPPSGHLYFTLKDDLSQLPAVWFRQSQRIVKPGDVDPRTGEVMDAGLDAELEEGSQVLVAGRLGVYEPRGAYQLIVEFVQAEGVGELYARFEALKAKLAGLGYFDEARKMKLPRHARRVAVVTSPTGAAVQDFVRIANGRGWGSEIRIHPSLVQGNQAPGQIAEAVRRIVADGWADVVALVRGGGSIEDLWAFNTEEVAEAIFECPLPVVSGVGHETDVTIADYVADVRAATPSHAAQLLWPERNMLAQQVDGLEQILLNLGTRLVSERSEVLEGLLGSLERSMLHAFDKGENSLGQSERALRWLSPEKRVNRWQERLDRCAADLQRAGDVLTARRTSEVEALTRRLQSASEVWLRGQEQTLKLAGVTLEALDPQKPLERGYGLVRVERTGRFLRSVSEATSGDTLDIRVKDGAVAATVTSTREDV